MGKLAIYARLKPMHDAVGRADYISNPDRQENLLAVAGNTDPEFWKRLAVDSQTAWKTSGGARMNTTREGKCVQKKACEAREVHIQLPKDILQKSKSEQQDIAEDLAIIFREKFGVDCLVGLHESKTKDNVHAHVLFPERLELPEPVIRRADRNVFLDANGIRKRTKKEIAPEVLDSVEVMKKVRQNHTKWIFYSPFRFNWYMVFCPVSGTYSGTKSSNEIEKFEAHEKQVPKIS